MILRSTIPTEMQGRVYACRNTLQFFTIPIGFFVGGFMVDEVCEPFMKSMSNAAFWTGLFGSGSGSGAAVMMFLLGLAGTTVCLIFGKILKQYTFVEKMD